MSEPLDPLEAELAALRPHEVSPGLRRRVAERLANSRPFPARRLVVIGLVGGLAAACLVAAVLLGQGGGRRVDTGRADSLPSPEPSVEVGDSMPTVLAYRHALTRPPEELEALLDKHAALILKPDPQPDQIHAFTRSDADLRAWIGEP